MYEIIKEHLKERRILSRSKYYNLNKRDQWPKFYWDLYPMGQEYFHELNPYFLFNIHTPDLFRFTKVFTVRDGYNTFATFILNNVTNFKKFGNVLFLIHPDLAPIVPPSLLGNFATWKIVQKKQVPLTEARKVTVFGCISDEYLGDFDSLEERLQILKKLDKNSKIEFFLPLRKNIFEYQNRDTVLIHKVVSLLKDLLPEIKMKFLTSENFFETSSFKEQYVFDLAYDRFIVSDSYLHYYVQSRGATVNNGSLLEAPEDSLFSIDLSLHHELHVTPIVQEKNIFTDLIFYKKQNPTNKDLNFDPGLQLLLRSLLAPSKPLTEKPYSI